MDYLPVQLYHGIKKLQDVQYFLSVHYDSRDQSIVKMIRLIDVSIKRIKDLNRFPPNAQEIINAMDPSNLVGLSVQLYNLQAYLCA